jgi:probable phosphoglycerate mutase
VAILLIRHGETPGNAARVVQTPETPLSERGIAQAERLAHRLRTREIGGILASDLTRAAMTARRIQEATDAPIVFEPLLHERNFGDVRGTRYDDLEVDLFAPDFVPPAGEGWDTFHARVTAAWAIVRATTAATPGDLAVVTHGLVCFSLVQHHFRVPEGTPVPERFGNTSLTVVEASPPWSVHTLNCTAHLDGEDGVNAPLQNEDAAGL